MRIIRSFSVAALLALSTLAVAFPSSALAHERRDVATKYQFVVGFLEEPAIQGVNNGVSLVVTLKDGNKPVEGLDKTLKVRVTQGSATQDFPLAAKFGSPGNYTAHFIPTRAGSYKFQFTGTIEGAEINE